MKILLYALAGIAALHCVEYFIIGRRIGKRAGLPIWKSCLLCLLGGFLWWLPLKRKLDTCGEGADNGS